MIRPLLPLLAAAMLCAAVPALANLVVVLNSRDASVTLLDRDTGAEKGVIPVGKEPHHLIPTPDGRELIVASAVGNELIFLDAATGAVNRRLPNIPDPYHLAFSPDRKWLVIAANRLDRVDVYRASDYTLAKRFEAPSIPSHIAFSPDSKYAFVTLQGSNELAAVDLATDRKSTRLNSSHT